MKRGESGLSLVVGVNKPPGMTSHDVVNRCRGIFGERRVGHAGTLDPLASGVLLVCVGPATRLNGYLTAHDKSYRADIVFGASTTTDDAEGDVLETGDPAPYLLQDDFARRFLQGVVGRHEQVPPQYSAIKVQGRKAYETARSGSRAQLEPRSIQVLAADLVEARADGAHVRWVVDFSVSKGTYIRALARDIGADVGCPAHLGALARLSSGRVDLAECVSLQTLEVLGAGAALDPVRALGLRYAFCDDVAGRVCNGAALPAGAVELFEPPAPAGAGVSCGCTGAHVRSGRPAEAGELVALVVENRMKALYRAVADGMHGTILKPECILATGAYRG